MLLTIAWLIVIGTLLIGFGLMSTVGRSIEGRSLWPGIMVTGFGIGSVVVAFLGSPDTLGVSDVPLAFIEIAAMVLGP